MEKYGKAEDGRRSKHLLNDLRKFNLCLVLRGCVLLFVEDISVTERHYGIRYGAHGNNRTVNIVRWMQTIASTKKNSFYYKECRCR